MTITQMIQAGPARANDLFGKLAETGDGAVKTRETLFAKLKEELELHARLEEQHLFPVLRKHKETRDLVADAVNDNRQARALLAELERLPKDGEEFPKKLAELKRVFQQHVRDERKDLLPAVRKALSDEEAQAIADKVEAGRTEVEEAKREEARRVRETAEAVTRPAKALVETGARAADAVTRTAQPALERMESFGSAAPSVAARAVNEAGVAWAQWANRTTLATADAALEFARMNTPLHLAQLQGRVVGEAVRAWFDVSARLTQVSLRASEEMMRGGRR
ncbi:hemerythrin domain-containing protein [Azospirillum sp. TSO22-1]|uniref:hemerythrin domain-containing protein n=1 Tax=Azospirillum sp. TSO22-1 TaxID=716789 RepID=UPI0018EEA87F|nr:hemerythrin domain-containing protein [Azospirillum sp. TSO22-1]